MINKFLNKKTLWIYSYHKRVFSEQIKINSYLQQRLIDRKFIPLKDFQAESFKVVNQERKNCFINSCTGSGKTLAYLLPIINRVLEQKDVLVSQSNKRYGQIQYERNIRHGALILTLNKELALQIYKQIRLLDTQSRLNVYRVGPISHFAPVVELLNKKEKTPEDEDQIVDGVQRNIVKCINWTKTDILIATPQLFFNVMTQISHNKMNAIYPRFIVFDEADLLLEIDQNLAKFTKKIIQMLTNQKNKSKNQKHIISQQKNQIQEEIHFLMSSSSFPKKINKMPYEQYFKKYFSPLQIITGINKHRLPERIQLQYIQIQTQSSTPNNQDQKIHQQKLFYLAKILTDPKKKQNRFIIFCNNKKSVDKISRFLIEKINLQCIQYYAGLPSDQRSLNLYRFMNEQINILVSTDLGSRGLDFSRPVHTIIEYDLAQNIINFINRGGRTGRNGMPGQIISFVEKKNSEFFKHLSEKSSQEEQFDDLFSRKRSYSKMLVKYEKE